jgi:hypothetical protein
MADISNQLIKDSYNNVVQVDPLTGEFLRIGGDPVQNPAFLCGVTITNGLVYSQGAQSGYLLSSDAYGNASWVIPPGGQGSSGTAGSSGSAGTSGSSGSSGSSGANGSSGSSGSAGTSGSSGSRGTSGSSGSSGQNGTSGSSGANGSGTVKGLQNYIAYFDNIGSVDTSIIYQKSGANIGIGTTSPNNSSILHLDSSTKGFLPPVMSSSDRDNINSPATGLMVYVNDNETGIYVFDGSIWKKLAYG